jgi:hypothetical protein
MADLPDVKSVLKSVYTPKLTLNKFVVKSLEKYPKLQLKDIQAFWKEATFKQKKEDSKEKPEKSAKAEIGSLDKEQRNALTDIMFRQAKGTLGVRAVWEELRDHPKQEAELQRTNNKFGWITWRQLRAFYNAFESNQRHRKANPVSKTLVKVPKQEDLLPFKKMQLDTLVFAKGNKVADGLPDAGLPDNGRRSVYNLVDLATNYNFLYAAKSAPNTADSTDAMKEWIEAVREHYGSWPRDSVIQIDGGPEYSDLFRGEIERFEPKIKFRQNKAYNPNDNSTVEGSMSIFRRIAKRHAENNRANRPRGAKKSYLSYWFGDQKGQILAELNMLMNTRKVSSLGYQSPADILEAYMDPNVHNRDEIITKARQAKLGTANARRGAAHIIKYKKGDKVRTISDHYIETAGARGNKTKQAPPWSKTVYTIAKVRGGISNVPQYKLEGEPHWYTHDKLQKIKGGIVLPSPADVVGQDPDYELYDTNTGNRLYYRGFWAPENRSALLPPPGAVVPPPLPPPPDDTDTESDSDDEADPPPLPARRTRRPPQRFNPSGNGLKLKKFP